MDRLPQELLNLIAEVVNYEDLEPLRLVNKAFAAAAAPLLFKVIPLWISIRSLERLTAISEHPQLCCYPREIFFSPLRFIDFEDDTGYEKDVKLWLEEKIQCSPIVHVHTLAKHMSTYHSYIGAQRLLSHNEWDIKILSRAFSLLSRVEILHVACFDRYIGLPELMHAFSGYLDPYLLTNNYHHTLPVLVQALAASSLKIKVFDLATEEDYYLATYEDYSCRSLSSRVGGSSNAASLGRPRSSRASPSKPYLHFSDGISIWALSETFCAENLEMCKMALSGLRELKVNEISAELDGAVSVSRTIAAVRGLLHCALCVESVTLEGLSTISLLRPSMSSVMPYGFNKIKKLNIHNYDTTVEFVSAFFDRHRTIVKANFHSVPITGSNWSTALIELRTLYLARLEIFTLSYCDGKEDDLQVQDYILKKTDKDPLVEERKRLE